MGSPVAAQCLKYDAICFEITKRKIQISGATKTATSTCVTPAWPSHTASSINARFGQWGHKQVSSLSYHSFNTAPVKNSDGRGYSHSPSHQHTHQCPLHMWTSFLTLYFAWLTFFSYYHKKPFWLYILVIQTSHRFGILLFHIHWSVLLTQHLFSCRRHLAALRISHQPPWMGYLNIWLCGELVKLVKYANEKNKTKQAVTDQADKHGISSVITQLHNILQPISSQQFSSLAY